MPFSITPQYITVKGVQVPVDIKEVKFFPEVDRKTQQIKRFGKLNQSKVGRIYQITIANDAWTGGEVWTLKYNVDRNWFTILWSIQLDPVDPWDKQYEGVGHVRRVENVDRHLPATIFMNKLLERKVDPDTILRVMSLFNNVRQNQAA